MDLPGGVEVKLITPLRDVLFSSVPTSNFTVSILDLKRPFELAWCPSITLNLPAASGNTEKWGYGQVCRARHRCPRTLSKSNWCKPLLNIYKNRTSFLCSQNWNAWAPLRTSCNHLNFLKYRVYIIVLLTIPHNEPQRRAILHLKSQKRTTLNSGKDYC